MKIGDRVKFITMGGWYNSGIIKDMDDDSYLIEVDELGCKPPKDVHIPLPYYARVLACEKVSEPQESEDKKTIDAIDFAIKATDTQDDYSMGMRNGMRYVKYLIDGKAPQYESRRTEEEIKLGINLGDEVVGDYGAKGVVVGMETYKGEVLLSLLMRNHKVPQTVKASWYKTKTGRHFPQIVEVLEQI